MRGHGPRAWRVIALASALVLAPGAVAAPPSAAVPGRVIVVDDDRRQCAHADFTILQEALAEATDGDRVRVCAGLYREALTIDASVTVQGEVGAVASVACLDPATSAVGDLDATRFAVVRPPEGPQADGALVRIAADDVEVAGLVVEGRIDDVAEVPVPGAPLYDAAVSVSDAYSGIRLRHNLIRLNTLGVELGASDSRVDHNCFRDNGWVLANQRYVLERARIHDNTTYRTGVLTWEIGWAYRQASTVMVDHNVSHDPGFAVAYVVFAEDVVVASNEIVSTGARGVSLQSSSRVSVVDNDVTPSATGIFVGPGGEDVDITGNRVIAATGTQGGAAGITVGSPGAATTTAGVVIADNVVSGMRSGLGRGILLGLNAQPAGAVLRGNVVRENLDGIVLAPGNHRSTIVGNSALGDTTLAPSGNGFRVLVGARENVFTANLALGNATDARDEGLLAEGTTPTSNQWIRTTCDVDVPAGLICVPPVTGADGSAGP